MAHLIHLLGNVCLSLATSVAGSFIHHHHVKRKGNRP